MERRKFIQKSAFATLGTLIVPSVYGSPTSSILNENDITKVHLIFKTHLDIGFTNLAENVIQTYFTEFIPGALDLSEKMRNENLEDRYVWTTGSWLIYKFLENADPSMRKRMEKAIELGDISWHGLPFTTHSELADPSLFDLGLQLSAQLDKRFGKKTTAAKMTDVPGHTRSIIPILEKNNIEFLHIGVNPASTPPDVPPLFVWQAQNGSKIVVIYQKTYGSEMVIPGTKTAVSISFTNDNHGPHTPEQIAEIYKNLRTQFPNAEIKASTLNDVADEISTIKPNLPVITQELGDTWIHGAGSDPLKIARFREMSRFRNELLKNKSLQFGDPTDLAFGIPLLMVAEHTWGLDVKTWLKEWDKYESEAFQASLSKPNFKLMEKSWNEKREYILDSISQLPANLQVEANKRLQKIKPVHPEKNDFTKVDISKNDFETHFFELKVDPQTGGIIKLKDKISGFEWADQKSPLCLYNYQTFSAADYKKYHEQYLTIKTDWAFGDFGKTGMESAHPISKTWLPQLREILHKSGKTGTTLLLDLIVADKNGESIAGSPQKISLELFFPNNNKIIQATIQWFNKPAYRLPEASWFSFIPNVDNGKWELNKMGEFVDTTDIVKNGNRKLHAIMDVARFKNSKTSFEIESFDTPLIAPGEKNLLNFNNQQPLVKDGVHYCLHNNVWGTNFRMWFNDDMKYRFVFKA